MVNVSRQTGTDQLHGSGHLLDSRIGAAPWFSDCNFVPPVMMEAAPRPAARKKQ